MVCLINKLKIEAVISPYLFRNLHHIEPINLLPICQYFSKSSENQNWELPNHQFGFRRDHATIERIRRVSNRISYNLVFHRSVFWALYYIFWSPFIQQRYYSSFCWWYSCYDFLWRFILSITINIQARLRKCQ